MLKYQYFRFKYEQTPRKKAVFDFIYQKLNVLLLADKKFIFADWRVVITFETSFMTSILPLRRILWLNTWSSISWGTCTKLIYWLPETRRSIIALIKASNWVRQTNIIHTFPKIHFNIIPIYAQVYPNGLFTSVFPSEILYPFLYLACVLHARLSRRLWFITLIVREE